VSLPAAASVRVEERARQSLGSSQDAIYQMVDRELSVRGIGGGRLADVGCGSGGLWRVVGRRFDKYCGLDVVRYDGFPAGAEFRQVDLDAVHWGIADEQADVVTAVETIEHLENPWAFARSLVRLARPGGWVVVTTPNQLSALSLCTLILKRRYSAFQDSHYPTHRTALLEVDLERLAGDSGLESVEICFSQSGRMPLTAQHFPAGLARRFPRRLSDNVMVIGRKPATRVVTGR
jgi:2-polyprenyl-3-methyl-5-hydroxy-6-metoxy-1,4-benzoquinol methylase